MTRHDRAFVILEGTEIAGTISLFNVTGRPALSGMMATGSISTAPGGGLRRPLSPPVLEVAWHDLGRIGWRQAHATTWRRSACSKRTASPRVGLLRRHLLIGGE